MKSLRWSSFTLGVALCAAWVYVSPLIAQQTYTAETMHIFLEKCGDKAPKDIRVFLHDEGNVRTPKYIDDLDRWEVKTRSFNVRDRIVSLRDAGRRTGCAKATRKPTREGYPSIAQYVFKCSEFVNAWSTLTIINNAELPISTSRDFPGAVPCLEETTGDGVTELGFVAWKQEIIYVNFGKVGKPTYQYYDLLIRNGAIERRPIHDELTVTREDVLQQLTVRGGRGGGNAVTIRAQMNLDKSIKTIKLKVE